MIDYLEILGVKISTASRAAALSLVRGFLFSNKQFKIFTPNPEFLVAAQKDRNFKNILNSADLNICDGTGLQLASWGRLPRIPGVDFMLDICTICAQNNVGIFLLGGGDGAALTAGKKLAESIADLSIAGSDSGPSVSYTPGADRLELDEMQNQKLIQKINASGAGVLFVAFGMGKQEKWIHQNLANMPNVKIAMGVGGSFDYLSGNIRRAPCLMRKIGLEWLYRLIRQPARLGRIFNATVVFTYYIIKEKLN